jgi:hypothetical protein
MSAANTTAWLRAICIAVTILRGGESSARTDDAWVGVFVGSRSNLAGLYDRMSMTTLCAEGSEASVSKALP